MKKIQELTNLLPDLEKQSLGIARSQMPQISRDNIPEFLDELETDGIKVKRVKIEADDLKPTQDEINSDKVDRFQTADIGKKPLMIASDRYILDGHHQWAKAMVTDADMKLDCIQVDLPIRKLLDKARDFSKVHYKGFSESMLRLNRLIIEEEEVRDEKREYFEKRTKRHIDLVKKYAERIADYAERFKGLKEIAEIHDASKYKDPEIDPYIHITWDYKCKGEGIKYEMPPGMKEKALEATGYHVKNNKHHPEYYCQEQDGVVNPQDRIKGAGKILDAKDMPAIHIAEMVADWCACAEENGNNPKVWADKNVNVRWKFTEDQKNLIYELIDAAWKRDEEGIIAEGFGPMKIRDLIDYLKEMGFMGPFSGGKHAYMAKGKAKVAVPNFHGEELSRGLVNLIVKQANAALAMA